MHILIAGSNITNQPIYSCLSLIILLSAFNFAFNDPRYKVKVIIIRIGIIRIWIWVLVSLSYEATNYTTNYMLNYMLNWFFLFSHFSPVEMIDIIVQIYDWYH